MKLSLQPRLGRPRAALGLVLAAVVLLVPLAAAQPIDFDLPSQQADEALLSFSRQAKVELIFSFDEIHGRLSSPVSGLHEPEEALKLLLKGTGFTAKANAKGRLVIVPQVELTGSVRGRILAPNDTPAAGLRVLIPGTRRSVETDKSGGFYFSAVPEGSYQLVVTGGGFLPMIVDEVRIEADQVLTLETLSMDRPSDPSRMQPFVVQAHSAIPGPLGDGGAPPAPRTAAGNVDMPRSENDALDFQIFTRDQISRSGVIDLNEFLQREVLNADATALPPEQNANVASFASGSTNLSLGGFLPTDDATVVLVNGRRLPEIVTALPADPNKGPEPPQPDVNVIPIDLIERVEVLPASSSALYSGSPVGGVINIVLRPSVNTTELTTTYTNALARFDAPQSTTSFLHGETLLGGKLQLRLNATFTQVTPPTEAELGYVRASLAARPQAEDQLFRATPNVSSASGAPLFGAGTPALTSVAPGSDGSGGISAFAGRQGMQSLGLYSPPGGGLADSPNSLDYPYGRREKGMSLYGSVLYDPFPWLEVGVDGTASRTVNNTGYSILAGSLSLPASSPFNPFGQTVNVTLNDTAPALGPDYDEAHVDYYSAILGVLVKGWGGWQVSADAQYGLSITKFRGIEGVDNARWQQLVDQGLYNPLRDTRAYGPPQAFYDQALVFYGTRGQFVTLGDYTTLDASVRIANTALVLPTGTASLTLGGDYQYASLSTYTEDLLYGDGSPDGVTTTWVGRSLVRYSGFGEAQVPLLPARWLPAWILRVEADVAGRYTASDRANEANFAPTAAVKVDFAGGFSIRGTYATSNRFPPDYFSHAQQVAAGGVNGGLGPAQATTVNDPQRGNQSETIQASIAANPNLNPEAAVTQTAGLIYQRGREHRFRASVDFVDTNTSGENIFLDAQQLVDLENLFPQRVVRAAAAPGDPYGVGPVTAVYTGNFNSAWRRSENWNVALDYAWTQCRGGTLEAYCRWVLYQKYQLEVLPGSPVVDELSRPDGATQGLLRQRMNFGANWSGRALGFGVDGHYFHARALPAFDWADQGSEQVDPYWQFDAFVQADLGRWLPWASSHYSVRGQLRVDNVFDAGPPKFADDPSGAGVQQYGDWRGRVVSASVTVTF